MKTDYYEIHVVVRMPSAPIADLVKKHGFWTSTGFAQEPDSAQELVASAQEV